MRKPAFVSRLLAEAHFQRLLLEHRKALRRHSHLPLDARSKEKSAPLLIGYFEIGFGLGQYARGLAAALSASQQPFAVYPYDFRVTRGTPIRDWEHCYDASGAHQINVFCMAADQTPTALRVLGRRRTARSYNILSTFWELERAPEGWRGALSAFDELWMPNTFVAEAFRPVFDGPVTITPTCVDPNFAAIANKPSFGLEENRFWFLFSFDYNSFPARKNPVAVAEAFRTAFPEGTEPVGLVLKSNGNAERHPQVVERFRQISESDPRIRSLHGELSRQRILDLVASADCFVSLHRSEGFGLGMAEALLLERPVIATDYSGSTEFLSAATGYPVPYGMKQIVESEYPHGSGLSWADPDTAVAARFMRAVVANPEAALARARAGRLAILQRHSPAAVGETVAARLAEIRSRGRQAAR